MIMGDREYTPSILAKIECVIRSATLTITNFIFIGESIKNILNIDSFKQIELELVDFQYQSVPLTMPMFMNIKVKPNDLSRNRLNR